MSTSERNGSPFALEIPASCRRTLRVLDLEFASGCQGLQTPMRTPTKEELHRGGGAIGKARERRCFVVKNFEYRIKFRDLQQVMNPLRQVQQLNFSTLVRHGREHGNKLTDARAVNVADSSLRPSTTS